MRIPQNFLVLVLPTPWQQMERKTKALERKTTVTHRSRHKKGEKDMGGKKRKAKKRPLPQQNHACSWFQVCQKGKAKNRMVSASKSAKKQRLQIVWFQFC
jgi:hypothetical protein